MFEHGIYLSISKTIILINKSGVQGGLHFTDMSARCQATRMILRHIERALKT